MGKAAWRRAQGFLARDEWHQAVAELQTCVRLCPGNVPYHIRYQDVAYALPRVDRDGELVPDPATRAMQEYYTSWPDDEGSPLPPYFRARLQRLAGRDAPARQLLDEALKRDSRFYFGNHEYGLMWFGVGQKHKAAIHFRKAITTRPGFLESRLQLAQCYDELWEWPRAAEQYRVYLEKRPDDLVALRAYVTLIIYRVEGYLPDARSALLRLIEASGDDLSLQMDYAALTWKEGDHQAAIATYRRVLERDHRHARAALNLGNLHYEIGRSAKGAQRQSALAKARNAYRFFRSLKEATDAYDWFDLHLSSRARLREIDLELGARPPGPITWRDL